MEAIIIFSKIINVFFIFSFIGWVCEVLYVGIFFEHKYINRGFLFGPLCPIYGFGGLIMLCIPSYFQDSILKLFITGFVSCSILEYISSYILEKIFNTTWWDYSNKKIKIKSIEIPLHINGRVCLQNSILFGLMTVGVIKFIHPLLTKLLTSIPEKLLIIIAFTLSFIFVMDLVYSVYRLVDFTKHISRIHQIKLNLKEKFNNENWFNSSSVLNMINSIHQHAKSNREAFNSKIQLSLNKLKMTHKNSEVFIKKFPSLKSAKYKEVLTYLKEKLHTK